MDRHQRIWVEAKTADKSYYDAALDLGYEIGTAEIADKTLTSWPMRCPKCEELMDADKIDDRFWDFICKGCGQERIDRSPN